MLGVEWVSRGTRFLLPSERSWSRIGNKVCIQINIFNVVISFIPYQPLVCRYLNLQMREWRLREVK